MYLYMEEEREIYEYNHIYVYNIYIYTHIAKKFLPATGPKNAENANSQTKIKLY